MGQGLPYNERLESAMSRLPAVDDSRAKIVPVSKLGLCHVKLVTVEPYHAPTVPVDHPLPIITSLRTKS